MQCATINYKLQKISIQCNRMYLITRNVCKDYTKDVFIYGKGILSFPARVSNKANLNPDLYFRKHT